MRLHTISIVILLSIMLLIGCQDVDHQEQQGMSNIQHTTSGENHYETNEEIAKHLAKIASSVPYVNDAIAVVAGPYAVVGIDIDAEADRSRVGTIKYSVSEALQEDRYGKTAIVVADGDLLERLKTIRTKSQEGYPIEGIIDELATIVARYMPQLPIEEVEPPKQDQNKEMMPEEDEDFLEDMEKEHSEEK